MMETETNVLKGFFEQLPMASEASLVLDHDGVIAPFSAVVSEAWSSTSLSGLVESIVASCRTRVIVVSERDAAAVARCFPNLPRPEIWARRGLELLLPDGTYRSAGIDTELENAFAVADAWLEINGLANLVKFHAGAVTVSWEGLRDSEAHEARTCALRSIAHLRGSLKVAIYETATSIEVRSRTSNVSRLLCSLIDEMPFDAALAYLGSERSDPSEFRVLKDRGLGVLVAPELRISEADLWIQPPDQLTRFLAEWVGARWGKL